MKKINKRTLDWCIELTRLYWGKQEADSYSDILQDRINTAKDAGLDWYSLISLLDGIFSTHGFKPDATNWDIYLVLRLFGWEVEDEEVEDGESL